MDATHSDFSPGPGPEAHGGESVAIIDVHRIRSLDAKGFEELSSAVNVTGVRVQQLERRAELESGRNTMVQWRLNKFRWFVGHGQAV